MRMSYRWLSSRWLPRYPTGGCLKEGYSSGGCLTASYIVGDYYKGGYFIGGFPEEGHPLAGYPTADCPTGSRKSSYSRPSHAIYPTGNYRSVRVASRDYPVGTLSCSQLLCWELSHCAAFSFSHSTSHHSILSGCRFLQQICVYSFLCSELSLVSRKRSKYYSDQARG